MSRSKTGGTCEFGWEEGVGTPWVCWSESSLARQAERGCVQEECESCRPEAGVHCAASKAGVWAESCAVQWLATAQLAPWLYQLNGVCLPLPGIDAGMTASTYGAPMAWAPPCPKSATRRSAKCRSGRAFTRCWRATSAAPMLAALGANPAPSPHLNPVLLG